MNPYHHWKTFAMPARQSVAGNCDVQIQGIELVVTWRGIMVAAGYHDRPFSLNASLAKLFGVEPRRKGVSDKAMRPALTDSCIWDTAEQCEIVV